MEWHDSCNKDRSFTCLQHLLARTVLRSWHKERTSPLRARVKSLSNLNDSTVTHVTCHWDFIPGYLSAGRWNGDTREEIHENDPSSFEIICRASADSNERAAGSIRRKNCISGKLNFDWFDTAYICPADAIKTTVESPIASRVVIIVKLYLESYYGNDSLTYLNWIRGGKNIFTPFRLSSLSLFVSLFLPLTRLTRIRFLWRRNYICRVFT